jgi:ZIP family zinc transporter
VNNSEKTVRVAQVILNDAFVDFRQSRREVASGDAERITVSYPWVPGESYDVQLMTRTGATIAYGIEEAEPGAQQAVSSGARRSRRARPPRRGAP